MKLLESTSLDERFFLITRCPCVHKYVGFHTYCLLVFRWQGGKLARIHMSNTVFHITCDDVRHFVCYFFLILTETKIILQIFSIYNNYIGKCCKTCCIFLLTNFCPYLTGYENVFEFCLGTCIYKDKISMELWYWLV